jgi:hypothetical protein
MLPWLKANLKNFEEEGCWQTFKDGQFSLFSFEKKNMLLVGGSVCFSFVLNHRSCILLGYYSARWVKGDR